MSDPNSAWLSHRLRRSKDPNDPIVGWYGGHPRGVRTHDWPRCRVCGAPMCHMLQVNAGEHLNLGGHKRMSVFICHATGGRCEDWDPWVGSNQVILHDTLDDNMHDGPPTVRVYRRKRLTLDPVQDEHELMEKVKSQGLAMVEALHQMKHDKLGGAAVWLTGEATPQSRSGPGPMRMLMQFTTDVIPFDITAKGMGYVFIDPHDDSTNAAVMLWQGV